MEKSERKVKEREHEALSAKPPIALGGELSDLIQAEEIVPSFSLKELELAEKLKAAFNSAVFMGYNESFKFLHEALAQVRPLTYMESKAVRHTITAMQLENGLIRKRDELYKSAPPIDAPESEWGKYEEARTAFNREALLVLEHEDEARRTFVENTAEAYMLARMAGKHELARIITNARMASFRCKTGG